jgi:predicted lipid-binding transport protein (Tim44 family)
MAIGRMSAEQARQTEIALETMRRLIELPERIAAAVAAGTPPPAPPTPPASAPPPPAPPPASTASRLGSIRELLAAAAGVGVLISVLLGKLGIGEAVELIRKIFALP